MKYEICKIVLQNGKKLYTTIAWTDVISYAVQIKESLNITTDDRYAILTDGKEISNAHDLV